MNDIATIVVTYNPNLINLKKVITELSCFRIYISDNGSNNFNEMKKMVGNNANVFLINNKKNLGIAVAQNKATLKAKDSRFLFFLDQDSFIDKVSLQKLQKDYLKISNNTGIIAAVPESEINSVSGIKYVNEVISSGMLIPTWLFNKVGGMTDSLFIDMVDYELCWRVVKYDYKIAKDYNCAFKHQLGYNKVILGKIAISPIRLYYVFRNTIYLIKTKKTLSLGMSGKLIFRLCKQVIFNTFFCPNRLERLRYILMGIRDAYTSKMGKFDYEKK